MNKKVIAASALLLAAASPAFAEPITLTFEGANSTGFLTNFYNGGTDIPTNLANQSPASGTNYGIAFGGSFAALANDDPEFPYFTGARSPTVMNLLDGADALMTATRAGYGFIDGLSFTYSATEAFSIRVLDANSDVLATFLLGTTNDDCGPASFCGWSTSSLLTFNGIAKYIDFSGSAGVAAFDNLAVNQVPVPAAGWLLASGLAALARSRRKRVA